MVIGPGFRMTSVENAAVEARSVPAAFLSVSRMKSISGESLRRDESVLQRPALLPVPAVALKLLFGEMAEATLLASTRVLPELLQEYHFRHRHMQLEAALRHVLGR